MDKDIANQTRILFVEVPVRKDNWEADEATGDRVCNIVIDGSMLCDGTAVGDVGVCVGGIVGRGEGSDVGSYEGPVGR